MAARRREGIELFSSPERRFYSFYDPDDPSSMQQAILHLDDYLAAEGPFDAVLGFSAGAVLAALYIARKQREEASVPLRCAIFVSSAESTRRVAHLGLGVSGECDNTRIRILRRTYGAPMMTRPRPEGGDLSRLCDPAVSLTLVHDGGHEFPGRII